jgi:rod shape determining protein RodA
MMMLTHRLSKFQQKISEGLKKYDMSFLLAMLAIFFIGILNLYSATYSQSSIKGTNLYKVQTVWFLVSVVVALVVSFIRPKNFFRYSYIIYIFNLFLLLLVLVLGKTGMGAKRWLSLGFVSFQPSELMKLSVILALSRYFSKNSTGKEISIKDLIVPSFIAFVPAILIMAQPDLGTGGIIVLISAIVFFYKNLKWSSIFKILVLGSIVGLGMYHFGLKEYQKRRIQTFLNPHQDAKGSGYNAIQSEIAIGSGRLFGKGFLKSSQASLNFLPENHTDFVFALFNEEHGFFGSILLVFLYCILFLRFIWLSKICTKLFDSTLVVGVLSMFFWHTIINMGMVTGLLPIVGLPLPFMSYGGSSLISFAICIGLVTSVSNSRNLF